MSEAPFDAGPGGPPAGAPGSSAEAEPARGAPSLPLSAALPDAPAAVPVGVSGAGPVGPAPETALPQGAAPTAAPAPAGVTPRPPEAPASSGAAPAAPQAPPELPAPVPQPVALPGATAPGPATPGPAFERPPGSGWTQVPERVPAVARSRNWVAAAVARGLALFAGVVTLVSMAGLARTAVFDAAAWWIAVPYAPRYVGAGLLAAAGVAAVAYAVAPRMSVWRRWVTVALLALLAAAAVYGAVHFYLSWRSGDVRPQVPLPLSLVLAVLLGFLVWAALRDPPSRGWPAALILVATLAVCVLLFPPALAVTVGTIDYRRPADVAVVVGAAVNADGSASPALSERMTTAVEMYKAGLVKRIIVSGGVGESGYNEALVMRDIAVRDGAPAKDVVIDSNAVGLGATVADTVPFFGGDGWQHILAVDRPDQLPLVRLAYQRAGWDVLTVPQDGPSSLAQTFSGALRTVPTFWLYYLRAVLG